MTAPMIMAATESPITWFRPAPRAGGASATTVNTTVDTSLLGPDDDKQLFTQSQTYREVA
jgi:hypothetical protein